MIRQALLIVIFLAFALDGAASGVRTIEGAEFVLLLNNFEILAEQSGPPSATPYRVRILHVAMDGECAGSAETCPKRQLYVAVSEFGEAPKRAVYRLPDAYGWEFAAWGEPMSGPEGHELLPIVLRRSVVSPTPEKGWFSTVDYEVLVSPWAGKKK